MRRITLDVMCSFSYHYKRGFNYIYQFTFFSLNVNKSVVYSYLSEPIYWKKVIFISNKYKSWHLIYFLLYSRFPSVVLCQINVTDKDTKHRDESNIFVLNDNDMRSFGLKKKQNLSCCLNGHFLNKYNNDMNQVRFCLFFGLSRQNNH